MQVLCKAVADVDHGLDVGLLVQAKPLADAWREIEMIPQDAAAKRTGDHDPVAGPAPERSTGPRRWHAQKRDADAKRPVPAVGVPADEGDIESVGEFAAGRDKVLRKLAAACSAVDRR